MSNLTVVIPTLNEESQLSETLHLLRERAARPPQIIVVDGGSTDATKQIASHHRATFREVTGGRGEQLRLGVAHSPPEHDLLFLHADTHVPRHYDLAITTTLATPHTILGAFPLEIRHANFALRIVQYGANLRSRLLQRPYGDQGLFVKRSTLDLIGGYPSQPFLDDFELVRRLARHGHVRVADSAPVVTSARRWRKLGVVRTTLLNQFIIVGYSLGVPLEWLTLCYRGVVASKSLPQ